LLAKQNDQRFLASLGMTATWSPKSIVILQSQIEIRKSHETP
jgi:hypothetical protein